MKNHSISLILLFSLTSLVGCNKTVDRADVINESLDRSKSVTIKVAGSSETFLGFDKVASSFEKKYPNVSIEYEYIQDFTNLLPSRLADSNDIDLWVGSNIQPTSKTNALAQYAYNLYSDKNVNLEDCNKGIIKNSEYTGEVNTLYGVPFGGDIRGLFVNKTLLNHYNLTVPKTLDELMNCAKVLKENKLIPFLGNAGTFGQQLVYPYFCNIIANATNYDEIYNKVNNIDDGVEELFRDPMKIVYDLMSNYYYDYKYVENNYPTYKTFNNEDKKIGNMAKGFFNIAKGLDGADDYKVDDLGDLPFVVGSLTQQIHYEKTKSDYNSNIDYEFIMTPTSNDGGFVYLSPSEAMIINKNTNNIDWAVEFFNYFFTKSVNMSFANDYGCLPNIEDKSSIVEKYGVPENHISNVGSVTFKYGFYNIINDSVTAVSKGNNPSYMDLTDKSNPKLYSFDYYMNLLKQKFLTAKASLNG